MYRELSMIEVNEVLRRREAGQALREIARETGLDRKTVRRYAQAAQGAEAEDAEATVAAVIGEVQGRAAPSPSEPRQRLQEHRERIASWLQPKDGSRALRLTKVHVLLTRQGVNVTYATLCRWAHDELGWRERKSTVLLDDPEPGAEAQVDFGLMGKMHDPATGTMRKLWCLVVTLSFSRMLFAWPTFEQTTEAVCEGLDAAWAFFGGASKQILIDNTKAMVITAHPTAAKVTDAFNDYAIARGIFVDTARVRHPKDKARVENQVPFVRESWFDGEHFVDLEDSRRSAEQWSSEAAEREHGTTHRIVREHFETEEKATLLPAPTTRFDVPHWADALVQGDHHLTVLCALYSVPTIYIGKKVRVRADSAVVRVYLRGQLIKVHPRQLRGGRSTDPSDYPPGKEIYATRNADALRTRAREQGEHVGRYAELLLDRPLPWTAMRQGYELLKLCEVYGAAKVDVVCEQSLSFDVVDVPRIERMLRLALVAEEEAEGRGTLRRLPSSPRFARDPSTFTTRDPQEKR
jgi:transposase